MYNSIAFLLGHLVGDYLLQSKDMAINKSKPGSNGRSWCLIHCFIYSVVVAFFVILDGWRFHGIDFISNGLLLQCPPVITINFIITFLIIFATHYPIDRTSFGWTWMNWIGQSQFTDDPKDKRNYFVALVYVAVDNTMHLVLMWLALSFLGK